MALLCAGTRGAVGLVVPPRATRIRGVRQHAPHVDTPGIEVDDRNQPVGGAGNIEDGKFAHLVGAAIMRAYIREPLPARLFRDPIPGTQGGFRIGMLRPKLAQSPERENVHGPCACQRSGTRGTRVPLAPGPPAPAWACPGPYGSTRAARATWAVLLGSSRWTLRRLRAVLLPPATLPGVTIRMPPQSAIARSWRHQHPITVSRSSLARLRTTRRPCASSSGARGGIGAVKTS